MGRGRTGRQAMTLTAVATSAKARLSTALLAVLGFTGASIATAPPSHAGQGPVVTTIGTAVVEATFNDPVDHAGRDTAQLDKMISLINGTPAGASIYLAIHSITANIVYDAIASAHQRGVHIYVVHNGADRNSTDSTPADLANLLGADHHWCDHGSSTLAYGGGCVSTDASGIMHAKYALFSQTTDSSGVLRSWVSWFGSPNLTYASGTDLFNNAITVYGDQALYDSFRTYEWAPMWQESSYSGNDFYDSSVPRGYFGSSNSNVHVYSSPEQQTDLVANRLSYVNADADCRIRVMENTIHDNRSAVVDKLLSLHQGGCKVWVAVDQIQSTSLSRLKSAGISVHQAPVHDKAIVYYGKYAGSTNDRYIIFTGSHNLTYSALHENDEILVKIDDSQALYTAFYNHFNDAYNTGTPL
jgi:phosphatidylserine/phosphatidylglycerophosphate/cardiolipin synthase-like enzyme